MKYLLVFFFLVASLPEILAQNFKVEVSKIAQFIDYDAFVLKVVISKNGKVYESEPGKYFNIYNLFRMGFTDDERYQILKRIEPYFKDYTLCARKPRAFYLVSGNPPRGGVFPKGQKYTIAVEAMIIINYMMFGDEASFLSTFPVLYDRCTKTEVVFDDKEKISCLANSYKEWIESKKSTGKYSIKDIFSFDNGRITWLGGDNINSDEIRPFILTSVRSDFY